MKYIAYEEDSILKTATILNDDIDTFVSDNGITGHVEMSEQDIEDLLGYEDGLVIKNGKVVPDMDLLLDKKLDEIRPKRDEKLKDLDVEFLRLLETNSDTDSVVAQKNALRDLPATVSAMTFNSVDELISYWPPELS